ncbi:MAG: adenylate/guanylate cyclase domain-containing protein [Bacteriovoracaceae bacterium]
MKFSLLKYFSSPEDHSLSPEVSDGIKREQDSSEIIISWTQFIFSVSMFSIWLFSTFVRAHKPEYEIIPLILGAYTFFSIAKISWAKKGLVNEAVLSISVIVDIALVTSLIWLFHIQYKQAPGFYLKVPTFVYYFFFIALRGLRYETKFVLMAGLTSIFSWAALLYYALEHPATAVSRSFVNYTSSHDVLVGAEIEKIIGILVVTLATTISVHRKRKLLEQSVNDATARKNLTNFFSEDVAKAIHSDPNSLIPGHGKIAEASILTIDLRNFTKMTESWPPNDILKLISEYQSIVVPIILKNGGCIDKYMGDGILAHFGAARPSKTFAADTLKTMEEIQEAFSHWNQQRRSEGKPRLHFGQAASTGKVIFGTTGEKNRLEFTTIGSTVNIASKLEKVTKTLGVSSVLTQRTLKLSKTQGYHPNSEIKSMKSYDLPGSDESIDLVVFESFSQSKQDLAS